MKSWTLDKFTTAVIDKQYIVIDSETTLINKDKSIYSEIPTFILGVRYLADSSIYTHYTTISSYSSVVFGAPVPIVVGHNLAYDLLQTRARYEHFPRNFVYWDTAIAAYEMSGQTRTFPSLEESAEAYGIKATKDSAVSEMIKGGICPKDIPQNMLLDYCKQDVILTNLLFEKQFSHFIRLPRNLQNLILERMDYRINTHLMSMNGMYMDKLEMTSEIEVLNEKALHLNDLLTATMSYHLPEIPVLEINPSSTKQLENVLYGGTYSVKKDILTGEVYKTGPKAGTPKTRKEIIACEVVSPLYPCKATTLGTGGWTTKEEDLKKLSPKSAFVDSLLEYRGIMKELNTYFIGYLDAGYTYDRYNVINTEFKHTITPTGRISSTKPNIQNLTGD